jgi:hypothetical protein
MDESTEALEDKIFQEWLETLNAPVARVAGDAEWNHAAEGDQWLRMMGRTK